MRTEEEVQLALKGIEENCLFAQGNTASENLTALTTVQVLQWVLGQANEFGEIYDEINKHLGPPKPPADTVTE